MTPFPWDQAIGFGLGVLKLTPDAFWRMTPRELSYAIRGLRGETLQPLGRENFEALMRTFPDEVHDGG